MTIATTIKADDWVQTADTDDPLLVGYAYGDGKTLSCCGLGKSDSFPVLRADVKRLGRAEPTLMVRSLGDLISLFYSPSLDLWLTASRMAVPDEADHGMTANRRTLTYVVSPVQATSAAARALSAFTVYAAFLYQLDVCGQNRPLYRVARCASYDAALLRVTAASHWPAERKQRFKALLDGVRVPLPADAPSPAEQLLCDTGAGEPEALGQLRAAGTRTLTERFDLTYGTEKLFDAAHFQLLE